MWIANYAQSILEEMDADRISAPYYAERIEAGVISYGEAISSLIPPTSSIRPRLPGLIHGFPGSLWADEKHETRMKVFDNRLGYIKSRNTPLLLRSPVPSDLQRCTVSADSQLLLPRRH